MSLNDVPGAAASKLKRAAESVGYTKTILAGGMLAGSLIFGAVDHVVDISDAPAAIERTNERIAVVERRLDELGVVSKDNGRQIQVTQDRVTIVLRNTESNKETLAELLRATAVLNERTARWGPRND